MKINIAKSSGFCFGVRHAIDISKKLVEQEKNVFALGDIVHNSFVVNELQRLGLKKTTRLTPKKNAVLIIRAHGAPKSMFKKARVLGYRIIDATCPKVKDIYKIARRLEKNNTVIIIGDRNHDEVKGIAGQLRNKSITIENPGNIPLKRLSRIKKAAVITQSTQSIENINSVMDKLKKIIPRLKLYNTTCRTTRIKQEEINAMPSANDVMLIIGSKNSANTKRLFEISKVLNKNTYWIESAGNIKRPWLKGAKNVGIMAGASTPDEVTREVVKTLEEIEAAQKGP